MLFLNRHIDGCFVHPESAMLTRFPDFAGSGMAAWRDYQKSLEILQNQLVFADLVEDNFLADR